MQRILTIGPASSENKSIALLSEAATSFRLNIAHIPQKDLKSQIEKINGVLSSLNRDLSLTLDLQGAKTRIGEYPTQQALPEEVELFFGEKSVNVDQIAVPHKSVFDKTEVGDHLMLNDRKVELIVQSKDGNSIRAKVIKNGALSANKGINSPTRNFELAQVTDLDRHAIEVGLKYENVNFAVSFVFDGNESDLFRPLVGGRKLIAKIERPENFDYLPKIADKFDELWLCRGDLGSEVGLKQLGKFQKKFGSFIGHTATECILAGEVLGSMVNQPFPSRSEIVHLYDSIEMGYKGIVLSDESAAGNHLKEVVHFLNDFLGPV